MKRDSLSKAIYETSGVGMRLCLRELTGCGQHIRRYGRNHVHTHSSRPYSRLQCSKLLGAARRRH